MKFPPKIAIKYSREGTGTSANGQANVPEIRYTIKVPDGFKVGDLTFTVGTTQLTPLTVQQVGEGTYLIPTLDAGLKSGDDGYASQYIQMKYDGDASEATGYSKYIFHVSGQPDLTITAKAADGTTYPVVMGTGDFTSLKVPDNATTEGYSISIPEDSVTTNGNPDLGVLSSTKDDNGNVSTTGFTIAPLVENTDIATNDLTDTLGGFADESKVKPITTISGNLQQILGLVNTTDGNAEVKADVDSYTITVPYPDGVTAQTADNYLFQVLVFDGYDPSGDSETVTVDEIGTMDIADTGSGLQFTLEDLDASFVVLAKEKEGVYIIPQSITANGSQIPELRFEIDMASGLDLENPTYTVTKDGGDPVELKLQSKGEGIYAIPTLDAGLKLDDDENYSNDYLTLKKISGDDEPTVYKITLNDGVTFAVKDNDGVSVEYVSGAKVTIKPIKTTKSLSDSGISPALNTEEHMAYIIGYGDGSVRPEEYISRAEVATIFYRLLTDDVRAESTTDKNTFDDVDEGKWYNTAVSTMQALGIVNGRTGSTFAPNANITRAEFAAMCVRFDGGTTDERGSFSDINGHWAEAQIERAVALGWIDGYPDGSFRPDQPITRAEAMKLINRVLNRDPEDLTDLLDGMNVWSDNIDTDKWYYLAVQEATNSHEYTRKSSANEKWTELIVDSLQPDKEK